MTSDVSGDPARLRGPVLVIGCGLIGTSVGLALRESGVAVHLADLNPSTVEVAESLGAGTGAPVDAPQLVVVAVPPSVVSDMVADALERWPDAIVTDVGSVKHAIVEHAAGLPGGERFVGGHPMAGKERSGPMAASSRLFEGRPWAVVPSAATAPAATELVTALAELVGAVPRPMPADAHDEAVALVSHVPHVVSVLVAGLLADAPGDHLDLAGPGLRDVTRIAGSETGLWLDILDSNAPAVRGLLESVRASLDGVIGALGQDESVIAGALDTGRAGTRRIPGKHGDRPTATAIVFVQVPDQPGELSRLMADTGESGVNIEDIRIDHEYGRPVGLVEVEVIAERAAHLVESLTGRGWSAYRSETT